MVRNPWTYCGRVSEFRAFYCFIYPWRFRILITRFLLWAIFCFILNVVVYTVVLFYFAIVQVWFILLRGLKYLTLRLQFLVIKFHCLKRVRAFARHRISRCSFRSPITINNIQSLNEGHGTNSRSISLVHTLPAFLFLSDFVLIFTHLYTLFYLFNSRWRLPGLLSWCQGHTLSTRLSSSAKWLHLFDHAFNCTGLSVSVNASPLLVSLYLVSIHNHTSLLYLNNKSLSNPVCFVAYLRGDTLSMASSGARTICRLRCRSLWKALLCIKLERVECMSNLTALTSLECVWWMLSFRSRSDLFSMYPRNIFVVSVVPGVWGCH